MADDTIANAMTTSAKDRRGADPQRASLERTFARGRWLGVVALAVLVGTGGFPLGAAIGLPLTLAAGNALVWWGPSRVTTLRAQRAVGLGAVVLDAVVALSAVAFAPSALAPSINAVLAVVVAEVAVRYAPAKGLAASLALAGGLAGAMAFRAAHGTDDGFDTAVFLFWAALIAGLGSVLGVAVREVYRQRVDSVTARVSTPMELPAEALAELTPREREVLVLIAQGYSNQEIADALVIETKTVKNHINRMYAKLQLSSRYEAISRSLGARAAGEATTSSTG